jgi:hypothetical protein
MGFLFLGLAMIFVLVLIGLPVMFHCSIIHSDFPRYFARIPYTTLHTTSRERGRSRGQRSCIRPDANALGRCRRRAS